MAHSLAVVAFCGDWPKQLLFHSVLDQCRDNVKQTRITGTVLIFGVTGARHRCSAGESGLCTGNHHLMRTLTANNFSPVSGP
jgi:hypothetical protein